MLSCVWLFVTPWTVTSTRLLCPWNFPGKNTGVLPFPTPGNLPHPGIKPTPLASPALARRFFTNSSTCEIHYTSIKKKKKLVGNSLVRVGVTRLAYLRTAAAAAKLLQSCPTLCNPTDGSSPGSPVPGILQARTLEWVAISFSNAWKWKVKVKSFSHVRLLATPWIAAYQAPPSMGFSRQEYWSGVPLPSPYLRTRDLENT